MRAKKGLTKKQELLNLKRKHIKTILKFAKDNAATLWPAYRDSEGKSLDTLKASSVIKKQLGLIFQLSFTDQKTKLRNAKNDLSTLLNPLPYTEVRSICFDLIQLTNKKPLNELLIEANSLLSYSIWLDVAENASIRRTLKNHADITTVLNGVPAILKRSVKTNQLKKAMQDTSLDKQSMSEQLHKSNATAFPADTLNTTVDLSGFFQRASQNDIQKEHDIVEFLNSMMNMQSS